MQTIQGSTFGQFWIPSDVPSQPLKFGRTAEYGIEPSKVRDILPLCSSVTRVCDQYSIQLVPMMEHSPEGHKLETLQCPTPPCKVKLTRGMDGERHTSRHWKRSKVGAVVGLACRHWKIPVDRIGLTNGEGVTALVRPYGIHTSRKSDCWISIDFQSWEQSVPEPRPIIDDPPKVCILDYSQLGIVANHLRVSKT